MRKIIAAGLFAAIIQGQALATAPFVVPIVENDSSITVELCVTGECDSDSSNVAGSLTVSLDDAASPTMITGYDFDFALTSTIDLSIQIGDFIPLGTINATGSNISINYADPGIPLGPVPISGGAFLFEQVPTLASGTIDYEATGAVCVAFELEGLPCSDSIDLAEQGVIEGDIAGTVSVSGGVATVVFAPSVVIPFDEANPDTGSIAIDGMVSGSDIVPSKGDGDFDGDQDVDLIDLAEFLVCFDGDGSGLLPGCGAGDLDGQEDVDLADLGLFNAVITGPQ